MDQFAGGDEGPPHLILQFVSSLLHAGLGGQRSAIFYCYPVLFFSSRRDILCFSQYENERVPKGHKFLRPSLLPYLFDLASFC